MLSLASADQNKSSMAYSANALGNIFFELARYDSSKIYLQTGRDLSREIHNPYLLRKNLLYSAQLFQRLKDYPKATILYKELTAINKKLSLREKHTQRLNYEDEIGDHEQNILNSVEGEIAKVTLESKVKTYMLIISSLFIIIFAGVALFFVYKNKQEKKVNSLLQERNSVITTQKKEIRHQMRSGLTRIHGVLSILKLSLDNHIIIREVEKIETMIFALSSLQEHIFGLNYDSVERLEVKGYFERLADKICDTYGVLKKSVEFNFNIFSLTIDMDTFIPVAMIASELTSNALKHARAPAGSQLKIYVSIQEIGRRRLILKVADNGINLANQNKGYGLDIIRLLLKEINGTLDIDTQNGSIYTVNIKYKK